MAHNEWCGRLCGECLDNCKLDESIPCSPDCNYLLPDGSRDVINCREAECDAVVTMALGYASLALDGGVGRLTNCEVRVFIDGQYYCLVGIGSVKSLLAEWRGMAIKEMASKTADHIVYARDLRDKSDRIVSLYLYNEQRYSERYSGDKSYAGVQPLNAYGRIYAIHRRTASDQEKEES